MQIVGEQKKKNRGVRQSACRYTGHSFVISSEAEGRVEKFYNRLYKRKRGKTFRFFLCGKLVRWARLELAQAYAHYPLKVACLPFHHHRVFDLGLQRYYKISNLQTFYQLFFIFPY